MRARPTIYKGIRMRSRLEARFAANLDRGGVDWKYEPMCFANESGQYLPDFRVDRSTSYPEFWEVKPPLNWAGMWQAAMRMEIIWSSLPDAALIVSCWPGGGVLEGRQALKEDGTPSVWRRWVKRSGKGLAEEFTVVLGPEIMEVVYPGEHLSESALLAFEAEA